MSSTVPELDRVHAAVRDLDEALTWLPDELADQVGEPMHRLMDATLRYTREVLADVPDAGRPAQPAAAAADPGQHSATVESVATSKRCDLVLTVDELMGVAAAPSRETMLERGARRRPVIRSLRKRGRRPSPRG